jgi:hypothetical protein
MRRLLAIQGAGLEDSHEMEALFPFLQTPAYLHQNLSPEGLLMLFNYVVHVRE